MANREDLQERFRQLLVPLMRMSFHDKPTDVTLYCSKYFQTLLEKRQRSVNKSLEQSKIIKAIEKAERWEPMPHVQETTSLPILTDVHRDKLSIRETSSWKRPWYFKPTPRHFWQIAFDLDDPMSSIGDQPDSCTFSGEDSYLENYNLKAPPSKKHSDTKKREDSKKRQSYTKLAEGDQNLEAAEEQNRRYSSYEKQEKQGLISASGDFVALEDKNALERRQQEEEMESSSDCLTESRLYINCSAISEDEKELFDKKWIKLTL